MKHVMVDCETLGLRRSSVIVSIGAVVFDPYSQAPLGETFHEGIDIHSAVRHKMTMDASTVLWWLEQSNDARQRLVKKVRSGSSLSTVLGAFAGMLCRAGPVEAVKLWSCGSRDIEWLESAYEAVDAKAPWGYRVGDYRTIRDEFGTPGDEPEAGVSHDALSDAIWQAKYLQNVFVRLKLQEKDAEEIRRIRDGFRTSCLVSRG